MIIRWNGLPTNIWIEETPEETDPFKILAYNYDCNYFLVESFETREQAESYFDMLVAESDMEDE